MVVAKTNKHSRKLFLQFLLIFRKAAAGELAQDSGLLELYQQLNEIDVDKEGVAGAKNFFQAKVSHFQIVWIGSVRHRLHFPLHTLRKSNSSLANFSATVFETFLNRFDLVQ